MIQHVRTTDGVRIVADVHEAGPALPRLALVHSLAMDHTFWDPVVDRLARHVSILTIDARGHGESDKPAGPYGAERMALDLREVIDSIGWPSVVVAGASMGGCIALAFAGHHAETTQGLGLIDTTAWYGPQAPKEWSDRAQRARDRGLAALIDFQRTRWFSDAFQAEHPEVVERCVQTFLRNNVDAFAATCHMLGHFDGRPLLPAIRVPTTVLVGEEDYAAPPAMAQALHDGIAGSRLRVIQGARHLTPLESADIVADELRSLLSPSPAH